jgi:Fur family ferric uptake transcriptional regulator
MRMTNQRRIILQELRKVFSHPTAPEVYELVKHKLPNISLGTVYRNLEVLCDLGLIQKIDVAGTQKRFDGTVVDHYHVRCLSCSRIDDVPLEILHSLDTAARELSDYEVIKHRLEFLGLCPECKAKTDKSSARKC